MSVYDVFEQLQYLPMMRALRHSSWVFPAIASVHLMGLALIGGAILIVDLRLLGWGLKDQPVASVARDAERWLFVSLAVMLSTGFVQFMCFAATKYYYLTSFWIKVASLVLALVFTFTVRRRVSLAADAHLRPARNRLVALTSLGLWTVVGVAGRLIGLP